MSENKGELEQDAIFKIKRALFVCFIELWGIYSQYGDIVHAIQHSQGLKLGFEILKDTADLKKDVGLGVEEVDLINKLIDEGKDDE